MVDPIRVMEHSRNCGWMVGGGAGAEKVGKLERFPETGKEKNLNEREHERGDKRHTHTTPASGDTPF